MTPTSASNHQKHKRSQRPPLLLQKSPLRTSASSASSAVKSVLLYASLAGCSSPPQYAEADFHFFENRPQDLASAYAVAENDPSINSLIGIDKLLSAALLAGDWGEAERIAELASSRVNIFLGDQKGERDSLSFFGREKEKPFKGEPYERAMVDFYLGLLRFRRGDHEGALNAFLSAMAKDRGNYRMPVEKAKAREGTSNEETFLYDSNYATFAFFAARACKEIDEPEEAARHLADAKRHRPEMVPLFDRGMETESNVLGVIEAGRGPVKLQTGNRREVLSYRRGEKAELVDFRIDGRPASFGETEDLFSQASTLGGRAVDDLNRDKAIRQDALTAAGAALTAAGATAVHVGSHQSNPKTRRAAETAGLIAMGIGITTMIISESAVDPSADVRAWAFLPGQLFLIVATVPPGERKAEIRARAQRGPSLDQTWTGVPVEKDRPTLLYFRLLPARKGGNYPSSGAHRPPVGASTNPNQT